MGLLWGERGVGISSVNIPNIRPSEIEVSGRKKVIEALEEIEPQIIIYLASLLKDDFLRVASLRLINNLVRTTTDETERIMLLSTIVEINLVEKVCLKVGLHILCQTKPNQTQLEPFISGKIA